MQRITFQLADIQAFVAVAEKLNFKAAAISVFISQPALSRRIEKLETVVGARLLERTTRRVSLTDVGIQFLEHARAAIEELELGIDRISQSASRRSGLVTVACVPTATNHLLPQVLKRFAERYAKTRVRVIDEGAQGVLASVVSGEADFGINFLGTQEPEIEFKAIHTDKYLLAVPANHKLAKKSAVTWEELADERFIAVAKNSGNRVLMDHALAKLARRPTIFYEANHVAGALGMVAAGLGIAAIPGLALSENTYPTVIGLTLTRPTINRTLGLIAKKGRSLQPAAAALYELLKNPLKSKH